MEPNLSRIKLVTIFAKGEKYLAEEVVAENYSNTMTRRLSLPYRCKTPSFQHVTSTRKLDISFFEEIALRQNSESFHAIRRFSSTIQTFLQEFAPAFRQSDNEYRSVSRFLIFCIYFQRRTEVNLNQRYHEIFNLELHSLYYLCFRK